MNMNQKISIMGSSSSNEQQNQNGMTLNSQQEATSSTISYNHSTFVPPHSIGTAFMTNRNQHQDHNMGTLYNLPEAQTIGLRTIAPVPIPVQATNTQGMGQQHQNLAARNRKLQVDDALSYLERVRQQFANNPERYNEFLEVMKEFKSHTIDTNGVIMRVSGLFRDHPDLINGFNTFLPPGFEVHVKMNTAGDYSIQINHPNGAQMINADQQIPIQPAPEFSSNIQHIPTNATVLNQISHRAPELINSQFIGNPTHEALRPSVSISQPQQIVLNPPVVQNQMNAFESNELRTCRSALQEQPNITTTASILVQPQQPIHFEQAVGYLNKIKERFANKPQIYQQFLAILGNYQKSDGTQKLNESGVYQEVAKLFKNESDLMRDFTSFLPDARLEVTDQPNRPSHVDLIEADRNSRADRNAGGQVDGSAEVLLEATTSANSATKKRPAAMGSSGGEHLASKKARGSSRITYETPINEILDEIPLKHFAFFEKVQHALQSETIYFNFLRSLSLYNKSIMSKDELLQFVTPFLSPHPTLLKQFKDMLGDMAEIERHPYRQISLENRLPSERAYQIDFTHSKQLGVSYRSLPDDYEQPQCTGRTELCREVLNDKWVCYPTWSSEDTSVTSKKSSFEDVICRTEDERFEVDILIETNSSAMAALEIARDKIKGMNTEQAAKWMSENQNELGCSYTVISRAVRKLYGESANKVLTALRENPLVTVPGVHLRMSERDIQWKTTREEYNTIWRDQVEKNYLKSLDHQALLFKANDVKNIRTRSIISQLETIYEERREKVEKKQPVEMGPHLLIEYPENRQIFRDANELILHYVKRHHLNLREKQNIENLLSSMIPRVFMLKKQLFSGSRFGGAAGISSMEEITAAAAVGGRESSNEQMSPRPQQKGNSNNLDKNLEGLDEHEALDCEDNAALEENGLSTLAQSTPSVHHLNYTLFFGTNPWLLFIRLHNILCYRLATIEKRTEELLEEYNAEMKYREKQKEVYNRFGNTPESHQYNAVDVHSGIRKLKKAVQNPENFYQIMLQEMKNLLDGTVDSANFEDTLRGMFDTKAYVLFTMDKLISTITLHLKTFASDSNSMSCIKLFDEYIKRRTNGCEQGELAKKADADYEAEAEKLLINGKCYKMYFLNHSQPIVTVELIDTFEPESESDEEEEEKESSNVVALPDWTQFLKNNGIDENGLASTAEGMQGIGKFAMKRNIRYRTVLAEALRANAKKSDSAEDSNEKEKEASSSGGMAMKKKTPQFFASNGLCTLLNAKTSIVALMAERTFWDEELVDIFVRKGAPGLGRKGHRKISSARRKRWISWLEKRQENQVVSARWLTNGCQTRICQHHRFKYLRFTKYSSSTAQ